MDFGVISIDWEQVGDWTAVTFLGVSFLFLMQWLVRSMTQEFRQLRKEHHTMQIMQMEMFRLLIMHDAQIRGVNPTAGENMTEVHQRALECYQRCLALLENIERAVVEETKTKT